MLSNRSNPPLCQVSMFNTSPISRKCDITVRTCKLLRHIIPLEEIDRNCLQLSYALFFGLIHISLTFSERDVGTALSYRDKNHFGASISRKTNFKSSIWKWQRRHFRKLLEVARFSLRDVTMAKIVRTNKLPKLSTSLLSITAVQILQARLLIQPRSLEKTRERAGKAFPTPRTCVSFRVRLSRA